MLFLVRISMQMHNLGMVFLSLPSIGEKSSKSPTYCPASISQDTYSGVPLAPWPQFRASGLFKTGSLLD